jgi:hypothetical protein
MSDDEQRFSAVAGPALSHAATAFDNRRNFHYCTRRHGQRGAEGDRFPHPARRKYLPACEKLRLRDAGDILSTVAMLSTVSGCKCVLLSRPAYAYFPKVS